MKRFVITVTAVVLAVTALPASAEAADPVSVLKAQLSKNRGVTVVERGTKPTEKVVGIRTKVLVELDRAGRPVASDRTIMTLGPADIAQHARDIIVNGRMYYRGRIFNEGSPVLPEGKQWVLRAGKARPAVGFLQVVNVLEPATLGALLKSTTTVRRSKGETLYSGAISLGEIYKVSSSLRADYPKGFDYKMAILNWRLSTDSKGLVRRLVTSEKNSDSTDLIFDTRFSDWRPEVTIQAPPADEVAKQSEVGHA
ncbi:hypothetical protein [Nonomuraea jabiensis]|uniref:Lipoprotein LprG n=1 Tax=Nonomuraea jabiensis TaxID=882448 RepID=A0A7W9G435_9ACTN|nr:hypothetical protein [Nonomuraea jabiensis]MBB5776782.1 hypothetical protein [Nonomuraea jabiensis]